MQTRLASACNAVFEIGWLFALILIPLFFNVFSARSFEPDKTVLIRSIALVMCAAWFIKWIEEYPSSRSSKMNSNGTGTRERSHFLRLLVNTPCVLLVILLLSSFTLSTVISIFPRISFFGSYSRLQGLYTFLSYSAIFFILVSSLERKEQIERLFKVVIFTSVPISLYGILQHYQFDTLTWSTTMGERIIGANMGNPIFVAAYLIMVVPVTASMLLRTFVANHEMKGGHFVVWMNASSYIVIIILQVFCILFTQSRGPWLGLLGAFFIFFLGTLIFLAQKDVSVLSIGYKDALHALLFALGGIISGFLPAYVYCFVKRKGFRWLWLGFIFQAIIITAFIIALNIPNTPLKGVQKIPYVSRLGELSYKAESGTTRVRVLIWDGTIDLIRSNPFRMIVGYGPESMKHVWDQHAPAELAQHESKSAAPDRAHNEALDRIVTTGIIGLLIYMCLVGSVFYYSLKWLGLINSQSQRVLFFVLAIFGGILGVVLPRIVQGSFSFAGVGLSLGYIVSISIYMVVAPFMVRIVKHNDNIPVWKHFLILGLLSGITAHFIEIHFGIAIVSTRLYFFVFSAVIVALGIRELNAPIANVQAPAALSIAENQPKKGKQHRTKKEPTNKQVNAERHLKPALTYIPFRPVMVYALLIGLAISTINFSFIIHQPSQTDTFGIIWLSLVGQKQTYGTLILLIVTYLMGGLLVLNSLLTAYRGNGKKVDFLGSIGIYTATILLIFFVSSSVQTSYLKPGMDVSGVINFFFIFVLILGLAASYFLMPPLKTLSSVMWKKKALWAYPLIVLVAFLTIATSNIAPVRADIYLKLGQVQERNHRWNEGIRLVTRAIETDPYEETFYLNLGRILFGKANSSPDLNEKNATFEKIREVTERAHSLNPMNTDHTANLGLFYLRWAEFDPTPEGRQKKLGTSSLYFQEALEKSPKKTIILNNWARVIAAEGKFDESIKVLDRSLALDNAFAGTYIALGDIYGMYGRPKEAIRAYEKAVSFDQSNADAMSMLGLIYFKEGSLNEALEFTRRATELRPDLMKAQSLLGLIYFKLGRFQDAINANLKVLSMRPSDIGAHRNLVILYEKVGRREKAIKHLEAAIQFSPPQEKRQLEQILQYMHSGKSQAPGILN